jgi:hypothetical protein
METTETTTIFPADHLGYRLNPWRSPTTSPKSLFNAHPDTYREAALTQRRFKQKDILPLISKTTGQCRCTTLKRLENPSKGGTIQMIEGG